MSTSKYFFLQCRSHLYIAGSVLTCLIRGQCSADLWDLTCVSVCLCGCVSACVCVSVCLCVCVSVYMGECQDDLWEPTYVCVCVRVCVCMCAHRGMNARMIY